MSTYTKVFNWEDVYFVPLKNSKTIAVERENSYEQSQENHERTVWRDFRR